MVPKRLALYSRISDPLASFGMVCGMVFPILMFPAAILYGLAELLIPELARCNAANSYQRIRYLAKRSLRVALIYGCCFGGLEFLLAAQLCEKLYGSTEAATYLQWYCLLIPMLYCDAITDAMIKGLGQQTASVRYNIFTSTLDVIFLYILLPKYGMQGYFLSFLITHLINFILSVRRLFKIVGPIISPKVPTLAIGGTVASVLVVCRVNSAFIRTSAFLLVFFCLLFLLQVLQKEDIHWMRGLIIKK